MLEQLPPEILLEIFSFLELGELYHIFSTLNFRFYCLLNHNTTDLYARLQPTTSFSLENYLHRIYHLSITDWSPTSVISLLRRPGLTNLRCLHIQSSSSDYFGPPTCNLLVQMLSLPNLVSSSLKLHSTLYVWGLELPVSQSIRHMSLSMITLDMLSILLIHVPQLRSLEVWLNSNGRTVDPAENDQFQCLHLRSLTLGLHNDITFREIAFLLDRMHALRSLKLSGSVWDQGFLNRAKWKNLLFGSRSFPLFRRTSINLQIRSTTNPENIPVILSRFRDNDFRKANFVVTHDQEHWFYLTCLLTH